MTDSKDQTWESYQIEGRLRTLAGTDVWRCVTALPGMDRAADLALRILDDYRSGEKAWVIYERCDPCALEFRLVRTTSYRSIRTEVLA